MTQWFDPKRTLKNQVSPSAYRHYSDGDYQDWVNVMTEDERRHRVRITSLQAVARLLARFGWGLELQPEHTTMVYVRRLNPLLNEAVMRNRQQIKRRLMDARRTLNATLPLWESVRLLRPVVLDKRMVQALVSMAKSWPEVMGVAYDGGSFESFDGTVVAPPDTIAIRFWPVCYKGEYTTGLSGVTTFHITASGQTTFLVDGPTGALHHPHFLNRGSLCYGSAQHDFDSQIHSLATLRDWWVGTDNHPAHTDWAEQARSWWDYWGEKFFGFYEGGQPEVYTDTVVVYQDELRDVHGRILRYAGWAYKNQELPVTDDGLDIPGLSLPEYTAPHGATFYIEAPEQSEGYDVEAEDKTAEAKVLPLDRDTLAGLLDDYNVLPAHYVLCYECDIRMDDDDVYTCEYCENQFCAAHFNVDCDICLSCFGAHYSECDNCGNSVRNDNLYSCHDCNESFCRDCVTRRGADFYCVSCLEVLDDTDVETPDDLVTTDENPEPHRVTLDAANGWVTTPMGGMAPLVNATAPFPVAPAWEPLGAGIGALYCCHPLHANQEVQASYRHQEPPTFDGPVWHIWPQTQEAYMGEYACEAHVPRTMPEIEAPVLPELVAAEVRRCVHHGNIDCRLCAQVEERTAYALDVPGTVLQSYQVYRGEHGVQYCGWNGCGGAYGLMVARPPARPATWYQPQGLAGPHGYRCGEHLPRVGGNVRNLGTLTHPIWQIEGTDYWNEHHIHWGNGWRPVGQPVDDYRPIADRGFECEWPSHYYYINNHTVTADNLRCAETATWEHNRRDMGDYNEPHYVCDAHHTAILGGGYHEEVTNRDE